VSLITAGKKLAPAFTRFCTDRCARKCQSCRDIIIIWPVSGRRDCLATVTVTWFCCYKMRGPCVQSRTISFSKLIQSRANKST